MARVRMMLLLSFVSLTVGYQNCGGGSGPRISKPEDPTQSQRRWRKKRVLVAESEVSLATVAMTLKRLKATEGTSMEITASFSDVPLDATFNLRLTDAHGNEICPQQGGKLGSQNFVKVQCHTIERVGKVVASLDALSAGVTISKISVF